MDAEKESAGSVTGQALTTLRSWTLRIKTARCLKQRRLSISPVQPWHRRSLLLLRLRSVRVGPRSPDRGADRGWTSSRASREQVPNPSLYMATQVSPIAATDESL